MLLSSLGVMIIGLTNELEVFPPSSVSGKSL